MINLRYIFRLTTAFFSRFKALIFIGIIFGAAFFFILRSVAPIFSRAKERIGITGRYNTTNLPISILGMVGSGLTRLNSSGNVEAGIAKSWETPDKGKTWIFKLKDDIKWQDGKKVTSDGISYQFSDVALERPDQKTIVFKLQTPYSAFPVVVARPVFKKGFLGTGEWKVKSIETSGTFVENLTLEKTDGASFIVYKFYPTEERTKLAFELGEVDKIQDIIDPKPVDSFARARISKNTETGEYAAVFFNTQDKIFGEKSLRQALSYAIDKSALPGERAVSPISKDSWAFNPQVKPYNYDPDKARQMIADYKKASKIENLNINLTTSPLLLPVAEKIAKNWEGVGVATNVQALSNIPSDYQALLAIFDIPDDPDQYSIWHSTQTSTNISRYQNPRIDKLLEDGRSETDSQVRKQIYFDFQRFLLEDSPAAFLYYPTVYTISRI